VITEDNYVECSSHVSYFLVDRNFQLEGIVYKNLDRKPWETGYIVPEYTRFCSINNLKELVKGHNGVIFKHIYLGRTGVDKVMKLDITDGQESILIPLELYDVVVIDDEIMHPLHEKYGERGLALHKVIYRDYFVDQNNRRSNNYYIEKAIFRIYEQREAVGEIEMTAKELFDCIMSVDGVSGVSKNFFGMSGLLYLDLYNGYPVAQVENDLSQPFKLEKSTSSLDQLQHWKDKMAMLGYEVKCTDSVLQSIKTNKTVKQLRIPDFLFIENNAFEQSYIEEIRISSNNTFLLPDYEDKLNGRQFYKNCNKQPIKITCDPGVKPLKQLTNGFELMYLCNKFDGLWTKIYSNTKYDIEERVLL
jgi:hypothetical protein